MTSFLQFESSEGDVFHFPTTFAAYSNFLSDQGFESIGEVIPLLSLNSSNLALLNQWIKLVNLEEPLSEEQLVEHQRNGRISQKEEDMFKSLEVGDLAKLIVTANFLECHLLTTNVVKYIMSQMRALSTEEFAKWFNRSETKESHI
ncbi:hypothetical protein QR680_010936 [Steinernema hermaphroditum]|uniref:Uncharacterized protein n=1 Tax=Steinernema hermaphroditum TaxID=289476 RepID=A0AA39IQJ8_9BILA|nr:hypothetical protein QR680_010936 [Steinernema hermaphroditum]